MDLPIMNDPEQFESSMRYLDEIIPKWMPDYKYGEILDLFPMRMPMYPLPVDPTEFLRLLRVLPLGHTTKADLLCKMRECSPQQAEGLMQAFRAELAERQNLSPAYWPALMGMERRLLKEWLWMEEFVLT